MSSNFKKLYEDEHILVIDKPEGVMIHEDGRSDDETIADMFHKEYPEVEGVGEKGRYGVVHRLDQGTTGVLILAKTRAAYRSLKAQFKEHTTRKIYRAIVEGWLREDTGMISAPLARAKSDFRKRTTVDPFSGDARGEEREAITRYKVLSRSEDAGKQYSYVEVYPLTGRTHQIRAHFRSIRHPIIGDELYGSRSGALRAVRSMLHAYSLTVDVPNKERTTFVAPLHDDMKKTLEELNFSC